MFTMRGTRTAARFVDHVRGYLDVLEWVSPDPAATIPAPGTSTASTADAGVSPATVAALGGRDGLCVPRAVTSFDPGGGPPREVTLRG